MFWHEDEDKTLPYQAPDDILDVSFAIRCKQLPLDHAWALSRAIRAALPWFDEDEVSGIHTIHVAESANGWLRPEDTDGQWLIPSRRTRLSMRIPKERLAAIQQLSGQTLDIAGHALTVGDSKEKSLSNTSVLFARQVLSAPEENEPEFLQRIATEIKQLTDLNVKKMLCGKSHLLQTADGHQLTRHLMIADLDNDPSIRIQQYGLGTGRKWGCGLFLPHKSIKTLKQTE